MLICIECDSSDGTAAMEVITLSANLDIASDLLWRHLTVTSGEDYSSQVLDWWHNRRTEPGHIPNGPDLVDVYQWFDVEIEIAECFTVDPSIGFAPIGPDGWKYTEKITV